MLRKLGESLVGQIGIRVQVVIEKFIDMTKPTGT